MTTGLKGGSMRLASTAFQHGGMILARYTCEGEDISPELSWKDAPPGTQSFVLVMHDPDAPRPGGFAHWVLFNIPGSVNHIDEGVPQQAIVPGVALQGRNDAGGIGYMGPCPPSGIHRYFVRLFALDTILNLKPGAILQQVITAMEGHILAEAELMAKYARRAEQAA
jgi:Raf kinase inhibitor-like YbhB/YbcL family protein